MPRPDPLPSPVAVSRGAILAVPVFAVTIVGCAIVTSLGSWMIAVVLAILVSLGFVLLIGKSAVLAFGGVLLCATAGIMGTSIETPMFGATIRGIRIDEATRYPRASIFHFTDGSVLTRAGWNVPVFGSSGKQRSHELYELRIAPIVGAGWTPDRPVTAWAVTSSPNSGMPESDWKGPARAGVRVISSSDADIRDAIVSAGQTYHLTSAKDVVLLHWLADPEAAVSGQYWRLFAVFCACAVIWGLLVASTWISARRRRHGGHPR